MELRLGEACFRVMGEFEQRLERLAEVDTSVWRYLTSGGST